MTQELLYAVEGHASLCTDTKQDVTFHDSLMKSPWKFSRFLTRTCSTWGMTETLSHQSFILTNQLTGRHKKTNKSTTYLKRKELACVWKTCLITWPAFLHYWSVLTCMTLLMTCGSMFKGNLKMLNRESETKAFSASNTLSLLTFTYTANVVSATWGHIWGMSVRLRLSLLNSLDNDIAQASLLLLGNCLAGVFQDRAAFTYIVHTSFKRSWTIRMESACNDRLEKETQDFNCYLIIWLTDRSGVWDKSSIRCIIAAKWNVL